MKSQILPGTAVRFTGLQRRSDLNGKEAKVVAFDAPSGRYKCLLLSGASSSETIGCKLENLDLRSGKVPEEDGTFSTSSLPRLSADDDDARASGVHGPLGQSRLPRHGVGMKQQ